MTVEFVSHLLSTLDVRLPWSRRAHNLAVAAGAPRSSDQRPPAARRPRLLRRAQRPPRRAGWFRRRLHDGIRHHRFTARTARRRPARTGRDGRQRTADHGDDHGAADRRCRHGLRQPDQRDPHRARVRASGRRRAPHRRPGDAEAVRPHGEQAGGRHRVDDGQDPRRCRRPQQRRVPRDRPHGLAGDPWPRRGVAAGERIRRRRRRHLVRRGAARRGRDRARGNRVLRVPPALQLGRRRQDPTADLRRDRRRSASP